jgi:hypothetical protein
MLGLVAVVAAVAAGCGGELPRPGTSGGGESGPTARPYDGPLLEPAADVTEYRPEDLLAAAGAAGRAIEIWTDRDGKRVPTTTMHSSVGSPHCNWETSHFVSTDAAGGPATFARDPEGVLPLTMLMASYDEAAAMPSDARDTGYRLGDWELWAVPGAALIFMRTSDGVEAWPAVKDGGGCL